LIEKSSPHRKSSRRISGKSESTPLRFGEIFQQTARAVRLSFWLVHWSADMSHRSTIVNA
jgi:hypothetical protein